MKFKVGDRVVMKTDRTEGQLRVRGVVTWISAGFRNVAVVSVLCDTGQEVLRKAWNLEMEEPLEALASTV